jgi:hypothetical protein
MIKYIVLLASFTLLGGCASMATINRLETQSGQGVFQVIEQDSSQPPAGFGDLKISLNLKTRKSGTVLIDTTDYGTERYQLLIGVNGQTQRVSGRMSSETGEYVGSNNPEAGNGVRYKFATTLRLPVGNHRIAFALPSDRFSFEQEIVIGQGPNLLELKPVYRAKHRSRLIGFNGNRTFYEGVSALIVSGQGG